MKNSIKQRKKFAMSLYAIKAAVKADLWTDGEYIYLDSKPFLRYLSEDCAIKFIYSLMIYGYDVKSLIAQYRQNKKIRI